MSVDPGLSGAIALINTATGEAVVDDMPFIIVKEHMVKSRKTGKKRKKVTRVVDGKAIGDWIEKYQPHRAVIEKVGSRPQQGVATTFTFGEAYGTACGAITAMGVPLERVRPQDWKRALGLIGTDKKASILLARSKFKRLSKRLARAKDDGRAEALLIGEYAAKNVLH